MPGSKDVEKRICRMLDMDEKELMAELERSFILSDDCDERIKTSLEEMMQEVDRLLLKIDQLEEDESEVCNWESNQE
jgi:alkyl hydroperoxide reductase subunit AhpC